MARKPYMIVVGTDFSRHSQRALRTAATEAARHPFAVVHVVHVAEAAHPDLELPPIPGYHLPSTGDGVVDTLRQLDDHVVSGLAGVELPADVRVVPHLLMNDPTLGLIQFAWEKGADLIVVGTSGRRSVGRWRLGSVAESVVRNAPCLVLVAGPPVLFGNDRAVRAQHALS